MSSRTVLVAAAVLAVAAAALLAVGCGTGQGSSGATPTPAMTPPASASAQPPSSAAPSSAATPSGTDAVIKGVPTPSGWTKTTRERIAQGGVHVRFTSDLSVLDVMTGYASLLTASGWTIAGGGGGNSQLGSGSLAAKGPNGRFLTLKVTGGGGHTAIDLAVWPSKPSTTNY